jgi:hypothetical protein
MAMAITRQTGDRLREMLMLEPSGTVEDMEAGFHSGDRDAVHKALAHARFLAEFLDDLGWTREDQRDSYEITMDPERMATGLRVMRPAYVELVEDSSYVSPAALAFHGVEAIEKDRVEGQAKLAAIDAILDRQSAEAVA